MVDPRIQFMPGRAVVKFHRDAAVGPDQHHDAGFLQLLEFVSNGLCPQRCNLVVGKLVWMGNGALDVVRDIGRDVLPPGRIIERFRIID